MARAGGVGGIAVQAGRGLHSVIQVLTSQRLRPGHSRGVRKHSGCRDGWQAGPGTLLPRRCGGRGRGWPRPRPAGLFLSHLIKSNQQKLWMRALRGPTAVPKGGLTSPPFACSARARHGLAARRGAESCRPAWAPPRVHGVCRPPGHDFWIPPQGPRVCRLLGSWSEAWRPSFQAPTPAQPPGRPHAHAHGRVPWSQASPPHPPRMAAPSCVALGRYQTMFVPH